MGTSSLQQAVSEPMTDAADDLRNAGRWIAALAERARQPELERPLRELRDAAERVGQAWCGAWLSGLAHLYEAGLRSLPLTARQPPGTDGAATHSSEWSSGDIRAI